VAEVVRELNGRRLARHLMEILPPAGVALAFERPIEQRLGTPRGVAAAQLAAGAALALADLSPASRKREEAGLRDGLAIGLAQATALAPGVSRNGATLTAARLLRFERPAANRLSRHAALPIIVAATGLKGHRLTRRGLPAGLAAPFAAGLGTAFVSTLASSRLVSRMDAARSYAPFALYRMALGAAALSVMTRRSVRLSR
jgi:undecaprenyl-diphosphatase